jgi:radical SAM protein with 4Fe4S-binding SPASM domain
MQKLMRFYGSNSIQNYKISKIKNWKIFKMSMKIDRIQFSLNSFERDRLWEEKRRYFKDYCVNRYQWHHYPKWHYVSPFPLHVDFEASSRCNLNCTMCFRHHIDKNNYGDMDFNLYKKGIDECAENELYSIRLSWRGESTMSDRLVDMIVYAKEKGIKEVSFLTNGYKLNGSLTKELIKAGLDYITVSVDGLEKDYNNLRKPLIFEETTEKLRNFYQLKNKIGNGYPLIKIQGIWSYIKNETEVFYRHFKDITDKINFNPEHDYSLRNVPQKNDLICQFPWQRITITWNGEIPLCIADWNIETNIGNLNNNTIKDVWHGEAMNEYRNIQLKMQRMTISACQRCHRQSLENIGDIPEGII